MKSLWLPCLLLVSCARVTQPIEPQAAPTRQMMAPAIIEPLPKEVRLVPDLLFASPGGVDLLLDLYLPEGVSNPPLVMTIHGGGWNSGNRKRAALAWLAREDYAVANIEYRLSQEAVFPAQIHDCKGALRWLRAHQQEYGYDANRVVVAGLSAGGHLATLLGVSEGVADLEGTTAACLDQSSAVQGIIDYFGPSDFIQRAKTQPKITDSPQGIVRKLLGAPVSEAPELAKIASPVTYVGPGDPPLLIFHGDMDKQVLPEQSERLLQVYQDAGLQAQLRIEPGLGHGWDHPTPKEKKLVLEFLEKLLR